jgi:hypothetical protein
MASPHGTDFCEAPGFTGASCRVYHDALFVGCIGFLRRPRAGGDLEL